MISQITIMEPPCWIMTQTSRPVVSKIATDVSVRTQIIIKVLKVLTWDVRFVLHRITSEMRTRKTPGSWDRRSDPSCRSYPVKRPNPTSEKRREWTSNGLYISIKVFDIKRKLCSTPEVLFRFWVQNFLTKFQTLKGLWSLPQREACAWQIATCHFLKGNAICDMTTQGLRLSHQMTIANIEVPVSLGYDFLYEQDYSIRVKDSCLKSKKISNDQEIIQSDPTSCPQNQKGNN